MNSILKTLKIEIKALDFEHISFDMNEGSSQFRLKLKNIDRVCMEKH